MQNKLRGWLADNSLTTDPKDRILVLESAGNAGHDEIYKEMREEDTGLRQETLVHVVTLYERIVARFLMNGFSVNTGLFHTSFYGNYRKGHLEPRKERNLRLFHPGQGGSRRDCKNRNRNSRRKGRCYVYHRCGRP